MIRIVVQITSGIILLFSISFSRLTAFVLRCFGQARKSMPDLYIDEHILHDGVRWLVRRRNHMNMFEEEGRFIHSAMQVRLLADIDLFILMVMIFTWTDDCVVLIITDLHLIRLGEFDLHMNLLSNFILALVKNWYPNCDRHIAPSTIIGVKVQQKVNE